MSTVQENSLLEGRARKVLFSGGVEAHNLKRDAVGEEAAKGGEKTLLNTKGDSFIISELV